MSILSSVLGRTAAAAVPIGMGFGAAAGLGAFEERRRAYLGNAAYETRYGQGVSNLSTLAIGAGIGYGALSAFGLGPVQNLVRDVGLAGRKIMSPMYRRIAVSRRDQFMSRAFEERRVLSQEPVISRRLAARRRRTHTQEMRNRRRPHDRLVRMETAKAARVAEQSFTLTTKIGLSAAVNAGSGYLTYQGILAFPRITAFAAGAIGGLAVGLAATKFPVRTMQIAAGIGAIGAGAMVGANTPVSRTPEGNITQWIPSDSPSARLNFSTAGLPLALHHNRKVQ